MTDGLIIVLVTDIVLLGLGLLFFWQWRKKDSDLGKRVSKLERDLGRKVSGLESDLETKTFGMELKMSEHPTYEDFAKLRNWVNLVVRGEIKPKKFIRKEEREGGK